MWNKFFSNAFVFNYGSQSCMNSVHCRGGPPARCNCLGMVRKTIFGRQAKGSDGKPGRSNTPKPRAPHATRSTGAIRKPAEQPRSRQASMPAPSASSWGSVFEQAMEVRRYARVAACACPQSCGPRLYALVCVGARAWAPARSAFFRKPQPKGVVAPPCTLPCGQKMRLQSGPKGGPFGGSGVQVGR